MNDVEEMYDVGTRMDFATFTERAFNTLLPRKVFQANWGIFAITHCLDQVKRGEIKQIVINVPPRSLKSLIASVAYPAFMLGHDPGARFICVSHNQELAHKFARDSQRLLDSDWYRRCFPAVEISKKTEEKLETSMGGSRLSTSIGGSVTGFGASTIIIDDPMKPDEAASSDARDRVNRYFDETLYSRLDDKSTGSIILVMQRLHGNDLSDHLLCKGDWDHLCLPAIAIQDEVIPLGDGEIYSRRIGEVLHPEREPQEVLDRIRRNLGSAAFEAQYQQSPVPADGLRVKRDWLKRYKVPLRNLCSISQSWDTAMKGDPRADYSVCTTWGERNGIHYLLDVYREKLDFPDLIRAVIRQREKFLPNATLVEDQGSGTSLIQTLRQNHGIHSIGRRSNQDKETRLTAVTPMFEGGQVLFPEDAPWLMELEKELLGFPNARHDDQVDSITQYLNWAREKMNGLWECDWGDEPSWSMENTAYNKQTGGSFIY